MAGRGRQGELFPEAAPPAGTCVINDRAMLRTQDDHRVVVVSGVVVAQYTIGDRMSEANAMVSLVEQGFADQNDVALAFGHSVRTVRRCQRRFEDVGLVGLGRPRGYPKGRARVAAGWSRLVLRLKTEGKSNRQIAHRTGVSEKTVRNLLRRLGWTESDGAQTTLPLAEGADPKLSAFPADADEKPPLIARAGADPKLSAFPDADLAADVPVTFDRDPANRVGDRVMARLGLLDDAAPLFQPGPAVPRAGVLLAIPALVATGVLAVADEVYGSLGPAFYGLRTTVLSLLLLALLRIKRPEGLKEHSPPDLGRLLGLDRAPEVKTLRRKLARLAAGGRAVEFGRQLAQRRVAARAEAVGFLYIDGHVRVYHGERPLPKAHVARMRLAMPATTDYWVNDREGEPLFVVTTEANVGLVKVLPSLLTEVRKLVGERRVTVVFDRGGYSPRLFRQLIADGFDILTYRKGRFRHLPRRRFHECRAAFDGREVSYQLADGGVCVGGLRLRQVVRRSDDGHQTPVLTSRRDLSAVEVAYRMFERWRQENFFKYLREEYALDALADYAVEAADPLREVPNPVWRKLDEQLRAARAELQRLSAVLGWEAIVNDECRRRTMRGFKIAQAGLSRELTVAMKCIAELKLRRDRVPHRVPVGEAIRAPVVKLATERKHLTNLLKMVAYQAESELLRLVAGHYRRVDDEGRTLVQTALNCAADVQVTPTELRITLAPLSSAHRTRAIAAICADLNRKPVRFPGTRLRLRYAVADPA